MGAERAQASDHDPRFRMSLFVWGGGAARDGEALSSSFAPYRLCAERMKRFQSERRSWSHAADPAVRAEYFWMNHEFVFIAMWPQQEQEMRRGCCFISGGGEITARFINPLRCFYQPAVKSDGIFFFFFRIIKRLSRDPGFLLCKYWYLSYDTVMVFIIHAIAFFIASGMYSTDLSRFFLVQAKGKNKIK